MKITRRQLKRIIAENLGLSRIDEASGTGPIKDKIVELIQMKVFR